MTALVIVAASLSAVLAWSNENPGLRRISGVAMLITILVTLGARTFISLLANIAVRLTAGNDVVVHYWYMRPYVWSIWTLALASLVAAAIIRAIRRHRSQIDAA